MFAKGDAVFRDDAMIGSQVRVGLRIVSFRKLVRRGDLNMATYYVELGVQLRHTPMCIMDGNGKHPLR